MPAKTLPAHRSTCRSRASSNWQTPCAAEGFRAPFEAADALLLWLFSKLAPALQLHRVHVHAGNAPEGNVQPRGRIERVPLRPGLAVDVFRRLLRFPVRIFCGLLEVAGTLDRKSTRLNSSHMSIS